MNTGISDNRTSLDWFILFGIYFVGLVFVTGVEFCGVYEREDTICYVDVLLIYGTELQTGG
jgi:hypothetical protein